jgi:glycosyltransferase involved in cell wall biosynthesis
MISIVIPVYNQAKKLAKCLDSILAQTHQDYEVIVVNDGSQENIGTVIDKFKPLFGDKLQYLMQNNQGAPSARNNGAKEAQGNYLLFCDADVVMRPQMLKTMVKTLKNNERASYAYSSFKFGPKTFKLWPFDAGKLKQMPYITTTSLMRTKDFPGFDESLKKFQDWDLWLTMLAQEHTGVWIDEVLFSIAGGGTMSSWLPSPAYKLMPWLKNVKKYKSAMEIIKHKHSL